MGKMRRDWKRMEANKIRKVTEERKCFKMKERIFARIRKSKLCGREASDDGDGRKECGGVKGKDEKRIEIKKRKNGRRWAGLKKTELEGRK